MDSRKIKFGSDIPQVRVIIWDIPDSDHAKAVKRAVVEGHGIIKNDNVLIEDKWSNIEKRLNNPESTIEGIIRPYTGFGQNDIIRAQKYYPETLFFHALHNNEFKQVFKFEDWQPPCVVVVGAGDDIEGRNNTCWGNGFEFWDEDFENTLGSDQASFSLGFICGKMLRLKDELNDKYEQGADWWTARYIMRQCCKRTESNRGGDTKWDIHNGYGRVDGKKALEYSDKFINNIPKDPYIVELGDIGDMECQLYGSVNIVADEVIGASEYIFYRNSVEIERTEDRIINDFLKVQDTYTYTYQCIDKYGNKTKMSEPKIVSFLLR